MNMKKTIAAIAAGAMAVSAMASSVSAIELADKVLSYNLAANLSKDTDGAVTISGSVSGVTLTAGTPLRVRVAIPAGMSVKSITVGGYYGGSPTTPITNPYTRVSDINADNYGNTVGQGYIDIPVSATGAGAGWFLADTGATLNVTVVYGHNETKLEKINNKIAEFGVYAGTSAAEPVYVPGGFYEDTSGNGTIEAAEMTKYYWLQNGKSITADIKSGKDIYGGDVKYAANGDHATAAALRTDVVASAFTAKGSQTYKLPFKSGPKDNENVVYYLQNGITVNGKTAKVRDNDNNYQNVLPVINDAIANYGTITFTFHTAADSIVWTPISGDHSFAKFYCASQWDETYDGDYNAALIDSDVNGDASKLVAVYDSRSWGADGSYKSFTQHLYNGTNDVYASQPGWGGFGGEDYYGGLWGDNNLFGGALVINENRCFALRAKF